MQKITQSILTVSQCEGRTYIQIPMESGYIEIAHKFIRNKRKAFHFSSMVHNCPVAILGHVDYLLRYSKWLL